MMERGTAAWQAATLFVLASFPSMLRAQQAVVVANGKIEINQVPVTISPPGQNSLRPLNPIAHEEAIGQLDKLIAYLREQASAVSKGEAGVRPLFPGGLQLDEVRRVVHEPPSEGWEWWTYKSKEIFRDWTPLPITVKEFIHDMSYGRIPFRRTTWTDVQFALSDLTQQLRDPSAHWDAVGYVNNNANRPAEPRIWGSVHAAEMIKDALLNPQNYSGAPPELSHIASAGSE